MQIEKTPEISPEPSHFSYLTWHLFMPISNAAFGEIVGGKFNVDSVAHEDTNAISAHSAGYRRQVDMLAVVDLYLEEGIRLFVHYGTREFDQFFFHLVISFDSRAKQHRTDILAKLQK